MATGTPERASHRIPPIGRLTVDTSTINLVAGMTR
jgi:hypothetical protein